MPTLDQLQADLRAGRQTAQALTDAALHRARDPQGEGARVFTALFAESAQAEARAADTLLAAGLGGPLAGLPISIKDLLDVAGQPTCSGSLALAETPPASQDSVAVQRLRAAGAVIVGRTNMSELAFTGVGMNPHFGTPLNPWDRTMGRIPGGSSSGAAVSVTDGMAVAAIGSDAGGSVRIPAALCGLAGFKPTQRRVSLVGARVLSTTLDSLGPLAPSVACCALLDAVLAGETPAPLPTLPLQGVRLAVPQSVVFDDIEAPVAAAFQATLDLLSKAGVVLVDVPFPALPAAMGLMVKVGFSAVECYAAHREVLKQNWHKLDPHVAARLQAGTTALAADYAALHRNRAALISQAAAYLAGFDGWVMPTVPMLAPAIAALAADDATFRRVNGLLLRNTMLVNLLDGCAVTVPCQTPGSAPVGFSIAGSAGQDRRILAIGAAIERLLHADRDAE